MTLQDIITALSQPLQNIAALTAQVASLTAQVADLQAKLAAQQPPTPTPAPTPTPTATPTPVTAAAWTYTKGIAQDAAYDMAWSSARMDKRGHIIFNAGNSHGDDATKINSLRVFRPVERDIVTVSPVTSPCRFAPVPAWCATVPGGIGPPNTDNHTAFYSPRLDAYFNLDANAIYRFDANGVSGQWTLSLDDVVAGLATRPHLQNSAAAWCDALDTGVAAGGDDWGDFSPYLYKVQPNPAGPQPYTLTRTLLSSVPAIGIGARNHAVCVGTTFYFGVGRIRDALGNAVPYQGFHKVDLNTLQATRLADCPLYIEYGQLTHDTKRNKLVMVGGGSVLSFDLATETWRTDGVTMDAWVHLVGAYDAATDAHYYRGGQAPGFDYQTSSLVFSLAESSTVPATATPTPAPAPATGGAWSIIAHGGGKPFNNYGAKHVALLYDDANDELIQCGGDFYSGGTTQPDGSPFALGSTKRDMWMAKPKDGALNWTQVQPEFMPEGQFQGAGGPDQVWWIKRTAVTPNEYWLLPGAYRAMQYERDPTLSPYPMKPAYWGDLYAPMRWKRPGWDPVTCKQKMYAGNVTDATKQIGRAQYEPDKFAAYDPVTDTAYCIADNFEIISFPFVKGDWAITMLGKPAADDSGNSIAGGSELSIGGSLMARVDRRIYGLCAWANDGHTETRTYLAWYDIDAGTRGLIRAPFDVDPVAFVPNVQPPHTFGERNPEESAGVVALNGELVVMRTYDVASAGQPCIWIYNVASAQWRDGERASFDVWGRGWCALPSLGSVIFFGAVGAPQESSDNAFLYRVQ